MMNRITMQYSFDALEKFRKSRGLPLGNDQYGHRYDLDSFVQFGDPAARFTIASPDNWISGFSKTMKTTSDDSSFSKQFALPFQEYVSDEKDLALLYYLSQDARMSLLTLGKKTHLSSDAVFYRIKKLIRAKYLTEFRPVINFDALSYSLQAILIKARRSKTTDALFRQYLRTDLNVLWAAELFGEWDYILYVLDHHQEEIHREVCKSLNFSILE